LFFSALTISIILIEKHLITKLRKHEKFKYLIENEATIVRNLVSKALSDGKVSEQDFEAITAKLKMFQTAKSHITSRSTKNDALLPRTNDFSV